MSAFVTESITWSISSDAGSRTLSGSQKETGTVEQVLSQSFPAGSSAASASLAFAHATLKSIFLLASANCTVVFNGSSGSVLTVNLLAGVPFVWDVSPGYFANPFTADVTSLSVTCTPATQLQARALN